MTRYDVDLFGIAKAAEWMDSYYTSRKPPTHVYIFNNNQAALQAITNTHNFQNQKSCLLFHHALTSFCSRHRDVGITLTWSPVQRERIADSTVRREALRACRITPRTSLNRVQSAAHQRAQARKKAFATWAKEWKENRQKEHGTTPFAYQYALTRPPDGRNHPLWTACMENKPTPSRHTTSTALRLAVGHAFTSDYTRRFRPDIPLDEHHCECGYADRSFYHLLYECPRFTHARIESAPFEQWHDLDPHNLMGEDSHQCQKFITFLIQSRAAHKPFSPPEVPFDPG